MPALQGPEAWQTDTLTAIGARLQQQPGKGSAAPVLVAVASGHGVGKSALVAWLMIWAMATAGNTRGVVTANTEIQLKTKTWAELAKWFRLSRVRHRFRLTGTALQAKDTEAAKSWRIDMVPWSLNQTESFAGLHNQGLRIPVGVELGDASRSGHGKWPGARPIKYRDHLGDCVR